MLNLHLLLTPLIAMITGAPFLAQSPPPSDTTSAISEDSGDNSSTATGYNANLKPLKSARSKAPEKQLLDNAAAMLPAEAILEQFDRAQQYVLKHEVEFTPEQHDKLQVWTLSHFNQLGCAADDLTKESSVQCMSDSCTPCDEAQQTSMVMEPQRSPKNSFAGGVEPQVLIFGL